MGLLETIGGFIFEITAIILIFIIGLLVTIYATQAHNQCKLAIKGEYSDVPDTDIPTYEAARHDLQQVVWIGWTIVSLSILFLIVFIIVIILFIPEEAVVEGGIAAEETAAAEAESIFSKFGNMARNKLEQEFKNQILDLIKQQNELERKEKTGLYFHVCFGGWIMTIIFAVMLVTVFSLGILAAAASVKIGNTEGKHGQGKAQVAAILGIVPFSIFIVWLTADSIYKWYISSKINTVEKERKEQKEKLKIEQIEQKEQKEKLKNEQKEQKENIVQSGSSQKNIPSISDKIIEMGGTKIKEYANSEEGKKLLSSTISKGSDAIVSALSKV